MGEESFGKRSVKTTNFFIGGFDSYVRASVYTTTL